MSVRDRRERRKRSASSGFPFIFVRLEQFCHLLEGATPALGVALDGVGTGQPRMTDEEFGSVTRRSDGHGDFGFDAGVRVGWLDDPREDDQGRRLDRSVYAADDDRRTFRQV